jgi:hypothetical protein
MEENELRKLRETLTSVSLSFCSVYIVNHNTVAVAFETVHCIQIPVHYEGPQQHAVFKNLYGIAEIAKAKVTDQFIIVSRFRACTDKLISESPLRRERRPSQ